MQEIFEKFLERYKAERNPARNTVIAIRHIIPKFLEFCQGKGRQDLDQVTREDIIAYLSSLNGSRTSTKKIHKAIITLFLNACFSYGYRKEKMESIPYKGPSDVPRAPLKGFTAEEMKTMAKNLHRLNLRERIIFNFISNKPLRISELTELSGGDVDLQAKTFTIYKSKNGKTRILELPKGTREDLKELIGEGKAKEESLFGISISTMEVTVKETLKKLRVDPRGRNSHAFRHTLIMSMLDSNLNVAVVAQIAGNTPKTIYSNYAGQVSMDEQRKAERAFDRLRREG